MDRTTVSSHFIQSIGYNEEEEILEIEFERGLYRYYQVPEIIHEELMDSPVPEQYFERNIQAKYKFEEVE